MLQSIKRFLIAILDFVRHKKSFAQDGEDVVLDSYLEGPKGYRGFFVDVGAHHPVRFSNTWMFYKKGWKGINIDPTPGSMRRFHWLRRRDLNLEIGVGAEASQLTFYCFNDPALNTFDPKLARERNTGKPYRIIKEVQVAVEPLSAILNKHLSAGQQIDFFTIDVEGLDLEVLKSNDWTKYTPTFILAEDSEFRPDKAADSEIYKFLKGKGYDMIATLKRTIIYRRQI